MIEKFNDVEVRSSGVIYNSTFEQIKKMYAVDPELAGELAISAIEIILTDQISSDDPMVDMLLTPAKVINDSNVFKYEMKKQASKDKKVRDMKLEEIADLFYNKGAKQREIAERLGLAQQTVSYRLGIIRSKHPELIPREGNETANLPKNESLPKNLPTNSDVYQNTNFTNFTKNENLVSLSDRENFSKNPSQSGKSFFDF